MIKRQFLDSLYSHPQSHKRLYSFKKKSGYTVNLSPSQLLKEINQETEIGKQVLESIKLQQKILLNLADQPE